MGCPHSKSLQDDDTSCSNESQDSITEDDKLVLSLPYEKVKQHLPAHPIVPFLTSNGELNYIHPIGITEDGDDISYIEVCKPRPAFILLSDLEKLETKLIEYNRDRMYDKKYDLIIIDRELENIEEFARRGCMVAEKEIGPPSKEEKIKEALSKYYSFDDDKEEKDSNFYNLKTTKKKALQLQLKLIQQMKQDKIEFGIADTKAKSLQFMIHNIIDPTLADNPKHTTKTNAPKKRWLKSTKDVNRKKEMSICEKNVMTLNKTPFQIFPYHASIGHWV